MFLMLCRAFLFSLLQYFFFSRKYYSPYFRGKLPGSLCKALVQWEWGCSAPMGGSGVQQLDQQVAGLGGFGQLCISHWHVPQWDVPQRCAPGLFRNHCPCHQTEQGAWEPHWGFASLPGPHSRVCSACCFPGSPCEISQARLGHQCYRADKLLAFCFIYFAFDTTHPYFCFTYVTPVFPKFWSTK